MLMIVFGAGASYDSCSTFRPDQDRLANHRLPLADELFANRPIFVNAMNEFRECLPLVNRLQDAAGGNYTVESRLQRFLVEADTYPRRHKQLAAVRWYLHRMLWRCQQEWNTVVRGRSNYCTFLDQVASLHDGLEPVILVTFNYDTMLEQELVHFGMDVQTLDGYVNHPLFKRDPG